MPTRRTLSKIIRTTTREPVIGQLPDPVIPTDLENVLFASLIIFISSSLKFLMPNNITDDIVRQLYHSYFYTILYHSIYFKLKMLSIK